MTANTSAVARNTGSLTPSQAQVVHARAIARRLEYKVYDLPVPAPVRDIVDELTAALAAQESPW